jgi:ABC-type oligopeptide transport system ATPase subunit
MTIVRCEEIRKYFKGKTGIVKAVDGVSLDIKKGDAFGLVGESGCGKTTLGKLILGILKPDSGSITRSTEKMQVVFQDPFNSLDPKMKILDILAEGLIINQPRTGRGRLNSPELKKKIEEALDLVRMPKESLRKYPHQFSGGERQRIAIGRAVLTDPELIVCDEPVSSLDVTIQLEILKLLKDIQRKLSVTYLFISHDLRVVRFLCNKLAVMRYGRIIESGATENVYGDPADAYTKALLSSAFYDTIKK